MTIIDFSGISVASIFVQHGREELSENMMRHMILNSISFYNRKFKQSHGDIVLACDHGSWRKEVFEFYKDNRKKGRELSPIDWVEVYGWLDNIKSEIDQYSPFTVVDVPRAEADDVIAVLVKGTQEFGCHEPVMIVSADKDFLQLQRYSNVSQYSNLLKKKLVEKDPRRYLFEHIVKGDTGDGVPNIFSDDDVLVTEGKRQTPVSKKKLEALYHSFLNDEDTAFEKDVHRRNFDRNQTVIDLNFLPRDIVEAIRTEFEAKSKVGKPVNKNAFLNYLIKKRCNTMIEKLPEFF